MPTPTENIAPEKKSGIFAQVWSDSGDLLRAAAYSALERPVDGLLQDYNHAAAGITHTPARATTLDLIAAPQHSNVWTTIGSAAGQVIDYYVLSKVIGRSRVSAQIFL